MHKECISLLSKCGSSQPPALPPRPPSMLLPSPTQDPLANRLSTTSIDDPATLVKVDYNVKSLMGDHASLPPLNIINANAPFPDYVNTRIEEHAWYVGYLDREAANTWLQGYPVGTYLVRARQRGIRAV